MYSGTKVFPYILKNSTAHFMNCFHCSSTLFVRLYSQTDKQGGFFSKCFRTLSIIRHSQGGIQPWRYFSCKDLLKSEQENWRISLAKFTDLRERIKQKLVTHNKYSSNLNHLMITFGDYIYFEENGCIFRSKLGEVGERNPEALLSTEALCFHDSFIQQIRISPDHGYMATGIKSASSEDSACIIVRLNPSSKVECIIPNVFSFEWATSEVLFYTTQKNLQCHDVYLADFGKKHSELVHRESDARYFVDLYRTKDKKCITINSNSKITSEVWLIDCYHPFKPPVLVQKRMEKVIYHVEHRNNELYILTTYGNPMGYKLMKAPIGSCGLENWQLVYTVKENTKLIDLEMFRDNCVAFLKFHGELYLDVISLVSSSIENVKLPVWACWLELEPQSVLNANTCYFWLMAPLHPPVRYAYSLVEKCLTEFTELEVPIARKYHTVRLEAKSKDETWVPITVFYKNNSMELHRMPLLIHVYGAYGVDLNMTFKAENLMLIKDGWILAFCHVRGGGELGLGWHKDGCMMKKQNGIQDLRACIKLLHERGYSQPLQTALMSVSAGGVLAGALCNTDPDLIRAVVLQAPFLDILNTMLSPHLPLTIEEQEEWGNPLADESCKKYIKSYCPYQNIRPQNYPSLFITVSENDQRIPLAGLLRYIRKLRKAVQEHVRASRSDTKGPRIPNIVLDVQPGGSHCSSAWEDSLKQVATQIAFLYSELGLDKQE